MWWVDPGTSSRRPCASGGRAVKATADTAYSARTLPLPVSQPCIAVGVTALRHPRDTFCQSPTPPNPPPLLCAPPGGQAGD